MVSLSSTESFYMEVGMCYGDVLAMKWLFLQNLLYKYDGFQSIRKTKTNDQMLNCHETEL